MKKQIQLGCCFVLVLYDTSYIYQFTVTSENTTMMMANDCFHLIVLFIKVPENCDKCPECKFKWLSAVILAKVCSDVLIHFKITN